MLFQQRKKQKSFPEKSKEFTRKTFNFNIVTFRLNEEIFPRRKRKKKIRSRRVFQGARKKRVQAVKCPMEN